MKLADFQHLARIFVGVFVALSLILAPAQAALLANSNGVAATMSSMQMADCKDQPCPCERSKPSCDMRFGCAAGCAGFSLSHVMSLTEHHAMLREVSFVRLDPALASIAKIPLRRPPRA